MDNLTPLSEEELKELEAESSKVGQHQVTTHTLRRLLVTIRNLQKKVDTATEEWAKMLHEAMDSEQDRGQAESDLEKAKELLRSASLTLFALKGTWEGPSYGVDMIDRRMTEIDDFAPPTKENS